MEIYIIIYIIIYIYIDGNLYIYLWLINQTNTLIDSSTIQRSWSNGIPLRRHISNRIQQKMSKTHKTEPMNETLKTLRFPTVFITSRCNVSRSCGKYLSNSHGVPLTF